MMEADTARVSHGRQEEIATASNAEALGSVLLTENDAMLTSSPKCTALFCLAGFAVSLLAVVASATCGSSSCLAWEQPMLIIQETG